MQIASSAHIPPTLKDIAAAQHIAQSASIKAADKDGDTDGSTSAASDTAAPDRSNTAQRGGALNVVA